MKSVLITGAASGFGRELARAFLARGWRVVATLRRMEERRGLFEAELRANPGRLGLLELDVASAPDRAAAARWVAEAMGGRLDCLVNNAGYGLFGALEECSEAEIRDQMEANFFGSVFLARAMLPALRASRGRIVQFSSALGFAGMPMTTVYCASKHALEGLFEGLRYELAPHGVQVMLVEPGSYRTGFGGRARWGSVEAPAYAKASRNFEEWKTWNFSRRPEHGPAALASDVVRRVERGWMPLRVRCGSDARFAWLAKRILPERLWVRLQELAYSRVFRSRPPGAWRLGAGGGT